MAENFRSIFDGNTLAKVAALLGAKGHIAFKVDDNDPRMGEGALGRNAACRWRKVRVRDL